MKGPSQVPVDVHPSAVGTIIVKLQPAKSGKRYALELDAYDSKKAREEGVPLFRRHMETCPDATLFSVKRLEL